MWRGPAASALYVQNWMEINSPLSVIDSTNHLWSLSVEEQFYLAWPICILAGWRWRRETGALLVAVGGIVACNLERIVLLVAGGDYSRLYFGTDVRADELLIGCALALLVAMGRTVRVPGWAAIAAAVGLVCVGVVPALTYSVLTPPLSIALAGATSGIIVLRLVQTPWAPLASAPMRHLGSLSYAVYLWHIIVRNVALCLGGVYFGVALFAVTLVMALGCAELSRRYIEAPLRRRVSSRLGLAPAAT